MVVPKSLILAPAVADSTGFTSMSSQATGLYCSGITAGVIGSTGARDTTGPGVARARVTFKDPEIDSVHLLPDFVTAASEPKTAASQSIAARILKFALATFIFFVLFVSFLIGSIFPCPGS